MFKSSYELKDPFNMKNFSYLLLSLVFSYILNAQQNAPDKQILKPMKAEDIEWIAGMPNLAKVKMNSTKK
tara:strand:+ start:2282 stop:2491 length:210 start_codon:yes stop_codon:yes gene_type:complete